MKHWFAFAAAAAIAMGAYAGNLHAAEVTKDKVCPENLNGKQMFLSGSVVEVGHDGFSQYMVVVDKNTACRVVVFVDDGVKPCQYQQSVTIALKVRKAEQSEVNYFDGGGNEPYYCHAPG